MSYPISAASTVTLHLSLALEDGTIAETTFADAPLTFVMGDGTLEQGLELGLYGLQCGDRQQLTLDPGQAFGLHDAAKVHQMPRSAFASGIVLEPGVIVGFETPAGEELAGAVVALEGEDVTVDFNHPLAGRTLIYEVEILDVIPAETNE